MHDKVLERDFVLKAFKDTLKVIQQEPPSVRRSLHRSQTEKQRRRHSYERDQLASTMFSETPTVPQSFSPSPDSIRTLMTASVPLNVETTLTL